MCCVAQTTLTAYTNETIVIIADALEITFRAVLLTNIQSVTRRRQLGVNSTEALVAIFELKVWYVTITADELTAKLWDYDVLTVIHNDLSNLFGFTLQSFSTLSVIFHTSSPTLLPTFSMNDTSDFIFYDLTTSADSMMFFLGSFGLLVPLVIFMLPYSNSKGLLAQPFPWSQDPTITETAYDMLKFKALQKKSPYESWFRLTVLEILNRHPLFTCKVAPFQNFSPTQRGIVTACAFATISVTQAYFYSSDPVFKKGSLQITSALFASIIAIVLIQLFVNSKPGRMHHQFQRKKCKCNHRLESVPQTIEGAMVDKMVDIYEDVRSNAMDMFTAPITTKIRNFILDNESNAWDESFEARDSPREILKRALKRGTITDEEFKNLVIIQNWLMKQTYSLPSFVITYTWIFACLIIYGCISLTITYSVEFDNDEEIHHMVFSQWATGSFISFVVFLFLLPILMAVVTGLYIFCCKRRNQKDVAYLEMILSLLLRNPKKLAKGDLDVIIGWMYQGPTEVMMVPVIGKHHTRDTSVSSVENFCHLGDESRPSYPDFKYDDIERDEGVLSPSSEERFEFAMSPGSRVDEPRKVERIGEESPKANESFEFGNIRVEVLADVADNPGMWMANDSSSPVAVSQGDRNQRRLSKSIINDWLEPSIAEAHVIQSQLEATSTFAEPSEGGYGDASPNQLGESIEEIGQLFPNNRKEFSDLSTSKRGLADPGVLGPGNLSDTELFWESKVQNPIDRVLELDETYGSCLDAKKKALSEVTNISKLIEMTDRSAKPIMKDEKPVEM